MANIRGEVVTPAAIEELLRRTLRDPSFRLGIWDPRRHAYLDTNGALFEPPSPVSGRDVTYIEEGDAPSVAIVHDPIVGDDRETAQGLAEVVVMLLENAKLVEELRASRSR